MLGVASMELSAGLQFIAMAAFTPVGTAVLMVGFLVSCIVRVLLRNEMLKKLYLVFSLAIVAYLVGLVGFFGSAANTGTQSFLLMLFSMFFGVPCGVGWLMGWPIAVAVQLTLFGSSHERARAEAEAGQTS